MNIVISSIISGTIGYFVKRGWDRILSEEEYRDELNHIISATIEEYAKIRPVESTHDTFPFYQSQAIINELVKLGIAESDEESVKNIEEELAKNEHIIKPKSGDLRLFLDLFYANCTKNEKIKQLHIEKYYKEEVFIISQKIDRLQNSVDQITILLGEGLKAEWKRQLDVYKEEIAKCKPKTALELLEKLDETIKESGNKIPNSVMAKLHQMKALCYEMMRNKKYDYEYHECYVLDDKNVQYMEHETIRLLYQKKKDEAVALANSIKDWDEDNPTASFVLSYDENREIFGKNLNVLPQYVKKSTKLLSLIFQYIISGRELSYTDPLIRFLIDNFERQEGICDDFAHFMENHRRLEYVQFVYIMMTHQYYFDKRMTPTPLMEEIYVLSTTLAQKMKGTEMEALFPEVYFFEGLSGYIVKDIKEGLVTAIDCIDVKKTNYLLLLAVCLQYEGYYKEAIKIADSMKEAKDQAHFLKMHIYNKTKNKEKALDEYGLYINSLVIIDKINFPRVVNGVINKMLNPTDASMIDMESLMTKQYEDEQHRILMVDLKKCIDEPNEDNYKVLCEDASNEDADFKSAIAFISLMCGYYQLALPIYDELVKRGMYDERMFYYLQALHLSKTRNGLLLNLLKDWRLNADHQEVKLLEIELQLRMKLREWEEALEIIRILYGMMSLTENLFATYLVVLVKNGKFEDVGELKDLAPSIMFTSDDYILETASALYEAGYLIDAMNFLMPYAKNPDRPRLRMFYLNLCHSTKDGNTALKQFDEVKEGVYVFYSLNGKEQKAPLYIKPDSRMPSIKALLGHKEGDVVLINKGLGTMSDKVVVKTIANDHYALMKEIYGEMENPVTSQLPGKMFKLPDNTDVASLNDFFIKNFASQEELRRRTFKDCLAQYDCGEMPYSMVPILLYEGDFIRGYYILSGEEHGILMNPQCRDEQIEDVQNVEYVLDYSSLMLFYELSRTEELEFKQRFVVSRVVEEIAQRELEKLEKSPDESMSLDISIEGVTPIFHTKESKQWQIGLIRGLLDWIHNNCRIETPEGRLDVLMEHNIGSEMQEGYSMDYVADYMKLVGKNRILISDDKLLQQMYLPIKQGMSSYTYLKKAFDDETICRKMLQMYYIGVPVNAEFAYKEFLKKEKGIENVFNQALKGWSYLEPMNRVFIISELVRLVKKIYLAPIIVTDLHREVENVFVAVLKGVNDINVFFFLHKKLNTEFKLLGQKLPQVLHDLLMALDKIAIGRSDVVI